jgi:hypothetical protein
LSITSQKEKHENKPVSACPNEITTDAIRKFEDHCKFFLLYTNPQILDLIVCNAHSRTLELGFGERKMMGEEFFVKGITYTK